MATTSLILVFIAGFISRIDGHKCSRCVQINDCVSGSMKVEEFSKGLIKVSQLSVGDIVRGVKGLNKNPVWCRVDTVTPRSTGSNFTTYDGFTKDHMVVVGDKVVPYGSNGKIEQSQLYTISTECDATLNTNGQLFSPISNTFCAKELNWNDYLTMMAAIRRVTRRTGYFWYLTDAFYNNDTAKVPYWTDMLHGMCDELLRCAKMGDCQKFEDIVKELVDGHLNRKYVVIVEQEFPNLGGDTKKHPAGTVSEVIRNDDSTKIILISTLSTMGVLLILVIVLVVFVVRRKKYNKREEECDSNEEVPEKFKYQKA